MDGLRNVLAKPHVGLLLVVPGRSDTLRVNGTARIVSEAPFFDRLVVQGSRPVPALVVHVEELFLHCGEAFLRSGLWVPGTWPAADAVPGPGEMVRSMKDLEARRPPRSTPCRAHDAEHHRY